MSQYRSLFLSIETARIPNISQIKITTIKTLIIPEIDSNNAVTINFIPKLWLINLRGLKVLSSLKIFTIDKSKSDLIKRSINDINTIKKSSYDHPSLKYEFSLNMNPKALAFIKNSTVKNKVKKRSK